jgi:hypothetical protein
MAAFGKSNQLACYPATTSNLGHAAIDEEFDSIDKAAVVGSEEQHSLRNFIGDADPSKRAYGSLGGDETRHLIFGQPQLVVTRCRYGTGADDVYTDLTIFQIDDPAAREGTQRGFGLGIDTERRHACSTPSSAVSLRAGQVAERVARPFGGLAPHHSPGAVAGLSLAAATDAQLPENWYKIMAREGFEPSKGF